MLPLIDKRSWQAWPENNVILYKIYSKGNFPDNKIYVDWLIDWSACLASKAMQHLIEICDQDTIPYSCNWSQEIFTVHVPLDSSTHNPAFKTVSLHFEILP